MCGEDWSLVAVWSVGGVSVDCGAIIEKIATLAFDRLTEI